VQRAALGLIAISGCQAIDWTVPDDAVFSDGCQGDKPPSTVVDETITVGELERSYVARFPGSYRTDFPFPLVFAFHGAGDNGASFRDWVELEEAAASRAIFVYPDALEDDEGLARWIGDVDGPDFALFAALRDRFFDDYCVDESRVFTVGYSNGAAFSNTHACVSPTQLRATAAVAGAGPFEPCADVPLPALIAHGTHDPVVAVENGEASRDRWLDHNGCEPETSGYDPGPCVAYEGCEAQVVWCEHDNPVQIAHGWPDFVEESIWALFERL
jgi:poly(3-hydroxybutyrate) depolymerase